MVEGTRCRSPRGRWIVPALTVALSAPGPRVAPVRAADAASPETIVVDLSGTAATSPFPHYWERIFGSGRAVLSLRDSYRQDLRRTKAATDLQYVRFHAILHDEVGVYDEDEHGTATYNFSYVDQIYDGLLAEGVKPFVELSFMPRKLAADRTRVFEFWYRPIVSPPKDYRRWDALIAAFARHLVTRYGVDEVASWYFEVWNEPNIGFWAGKPRQSTYLELYDHTARTLKGVSARLRVGGPSTAQAAWVDAFLRHCEEQGVPVDFVSSHVYANDSPEYVFHTHSPVPREQMVCRAVRKVQEEVRRSARPGLPLIFSEYNASFANEPKVTDTVYMGPWLATTVAQCDGLVDAMSFWTFSDVFEEHGPVKTPFYGGFGLLAAGGIPKPAFNAFELLHRLGDTRLRVDSDGVLATRRADGTLVLALWNYAPPDATGEHYVAPAAAGKSPGAPRRFRIRLAAEGAQGLVRLWRLDRDHGNVLARYDAMGRPPFPTRDQLAELERAGRNVAAESITAAQGQLDLEVPPQGLALLEIDPG